MWFAENALRQHASAPVAFQLDGKARRPVSQDCKATVLHLFLLIKIIFIYNFYNLVTFPTLFVIDYVGKSDRSERCVKCLYVHFTMRTVCFFMDVNTQTKAVISWACVVWFDLTFLREGRVEGRVGGKSSIECKIYNFGILY